MKILIVDDDEMIREVLAIALEGEGYEVRKAANGREALEILKKENIDLLITDIIMPFTEGIETIVTAKRNDPALKVIAISGGGRAGISDFLSIAKDSGADATLQKPLRPDELLKTVRDVITGNPVRSIAGT